MYNLETDDDEPQMSSISPVSDNAIEAAPQTPGFFSFLFNFALYVGALHLAPSAIHYAPQVLGFLMSKARRR